MKKEDIKSLEFHIEVDDYLGTLATILSLIRQNIEKNKHKKLSIEILNKAEKDLLYLQNNYKIKNYMKKKKSTKNNIKHILSKMNITEEDKKRWGKVAQLAVEALRKIK